METEKLKLDLSQPKIADINPKSLQSLTAEGRQILDNLNNIDGPIDENINLDDKIIENFAGKFGRASLYLQIEQLRRSTSNDDLLLGPLRVLESFQNLTGASGLTHQEVSKLREQLRKSAFTAFSLQKYADAIIYASECYNMTKNYLSSVNGTTLHKDMIFELLVLARSCALVGDFESGKKYKEELDILIKNTMRYISNEVMKSKCTGTERMKEAWSKIGFYPDSVTGPLITTEPATLLAIIEEGAELAKIYKCMKDADSYYERLVIFNEFIYGLNHPISADSSNQCSYHFFNQGDYFKSVKYAEKCLKIRIQVFGDVDSPNPSNLVADAYSNVGMLYRILGFPQDSLNALLSALDIRLRLSDGQRDSLDCQSTLLSIGILCHQYGQYRRALEIYKEAFEGIRLFKGFHSPEIMKIVQLIDTLSRDVTAATNSGPITAGSALEGNIGIAVVDPAIDPSTGLKPIIWNESITPSLTAYRYMIESRSGTIPKAFGLNRTPGISRMKSLFADDLRGFDIPSTALLPFVKNSFFSPEMLQFLNYLKSFGFLGSDGDYFEGRRRVPIINLPKVVGGHPVFQSNDSSKVVMERNSNVEAFCLEFKLPIPYVDENGYVSTDDMLGFDKNIFLPILDPEENKILTGINGVPLIVVLPLKFPIELNQSNLKKDNISSGGQNLTSNSNQVDHNKESTPEVNTQIEAHENPSVIDKNQEKIEIKEITALNNKNFSSKVETSNSKNGEFKNFLKSLNVPVKKVSFKEFVTKKINEDKNELNENDNLSESKKTDDLNVTSKETLLNKNNSSKISKEIKAPADTILNNVAFDQVEKKKSFKNITSSQIVEKSKNTVESIDKIINSDAQINNIGKKSMGVKKNTFEIPSNSKINSLTIKKTEFPNKTSPLTPKENSDKISIIDTHIESKNSDYEVILNDEQKTNLSTKNLVSKAFSPKSEKSEALFVEKLQSAANLNKNMGKKIIKSPKTSFKPTLLNVKVNNIKNVDIKKKGKIDLIPQKKILSNIGMKNSTNVVDTSKNAYSNMNKNVNLSSTGKKNFVSSSENNQKVINIKKKQETIVSSKENSNLNKNITNSASIVKKFDKKVIVNKKEETILKNTKVGLFKSTKDIGTNSLNNNLGLITSDRKQEDIPANKNGKVISLKKDQVDSLDIKSKKSIILKKFNFGKNTSDVKTTNITKKKDFNNVSKKDQLTKVDSKSFIQEKVGEHGSVMNPIIKKNFQNSTLIKKDIDLLSPNRNLTIKSSPKKKFNIPEINVIETNLKTKVINGNNHDPRIANVPVSNSPKIENHNSVNEQIDQKKKKNRKKLKNMFKFHNYDPKDLENEDHSTRNQKSLSELSESNDSFHQISGGNSIRHSDYYLSNGKNIDLNKLEFNSADLISPLRRTIDERIKKNFYECTKCTASMVIGVRSAFESSPKGPLPAINLIGAEGQVLETIPFFLDFENYFYRIALISARINSNVNSKKSDVPPIKKIVAALTPVAAEHTNAGEGLLMLGSPFGLSGTVFGSIPTSGPKGIGGYGAVGSYVPIERMIPVGSPGTLNYGAEGPQGQQSTGGFNGVRFASSAHDSGMTGQKNFNANKEASDGNKNLQDRFNALFNINPMHDARDQTKETDMQNLNEANINLRADLSNFIDNYKLAGEGSLKPGYEDELSSSSSGSSSTGSLSDELEKLLTNGGFDLLKKGFDQTGVTDWNSIDDFNNLVRTIEAVSASKKLNPVIKFSGEDDGDGGEFSGSDKSGTQEKNKEVVVKKEAAEPVKKAEEKKPAIPKATPKKPIKLMGGKKPPIPKKRETQAKAKSSIYRKLAWDIVEDPKGTIFSKNFSDYLNTLDLGDLEDYFGRKTVDPNAVEQSQAKKPSVIKLFTDAKRSYNMSICLSRFKKYSLGELRDIVIDLDNTKLSIDDAEILLTMVPTKSEIEVVTEYIKSGEDVKVLDRPEQYVAAMAGIPLFRERLLAYKFIKNFYSSYDTIAIPLEKFTNACLDIKNSGRIKKLMAAILKIGNILNQTDVKGFRSTILAKLEEFRTTSKPMKSFTEYLVNLFWDTDPDVLEVKKDFTALENLGKIDIEQLEIGISAFTSEYKQIVGFQELVNNNNKNKKSDIDYLESIIGNFMKETAGMIENLRASLESAKNLFIEVSKLFGETDASLKKLKFETFLKDFLIFVNAIDNRKRQKQDKVEREKKRSKR